MISQRKASKFDVTSGVKIIDLADEFLIPLETVNAGKFNFRCKCPSKDHKNGNESTNSCYINSKDNDFHCYGCQAHGNCIDFYMLCKHLDFGKAFLELRERVEPGEAQEIKDEEIDNFYILIKISKLIYQSMRKNMDELDFFKKLSILVDKEIAELDSKDYLKSQKLLKKVENTIRRKFS